ncbi:hypothetical protein MNBD_GAMMA11-1940 [hydrothermal vent metagenome]|uniref:Uncharacterized protein n=1 Tax=hydrothermal vent metagenome TaxID=652676 RepID=A0A3B0XAE3_9ZZZZ
MTHTNTKNAPDSYYAGPERRTASIPRRSSTMRRYRTRLESLVSDCRMPEARRKEDEEGYFAYDEQASEHPQRK